MTKNLEEKNPFTNVRYFPMLFLSLLNPLFSSYHFFISCVGLLKASYLHWSRSCVWTVLIRFPVRLFLTGFAFLLGWFLFTIKRPTFSSVGSSCPKATLYQHRSCSRVWTGLQLNSPNERMEINKSIRYFFIYSLPIKSAISSYHLLSSVVSGMLEIDC